MLNSNTLQNRPREFLAATGGTRTECEQLLPAFQAAYDKKRPPERTLDGPARQRRRGAGVKGKLPRTADKLLFILVSQKTNPLQTMHGWPFGLSQAQTHDGMHHVLPVLHQALAARAMQPARDASRVAVHPWTLEGAPALAIDGTERRRQRPTDAARHQDPSSGTKKAHTAKNIVLINAQTGKGVSRGPTVPGKKHDKKAADEDQLVYPVNATLDKDTGLQGYEPAGTLSQQPKKPPKARHCAWAITSSITSSPVRAWWWKMCLLGSNGVGLSKMSCA